MARCLPWTPRPMKPAFMLSPRRARQPYRPRLFLLGVELFPRILDLRNGCEFDIREVTADAFDAADIDILDDVAGLRIDRDRPARAVGIFPGLENGHRLIDVEFALGLLDHGIGRSHRVPALDAGEIRP